MKAEIITLSIIVALIAALGSLAGCGSDAQPLTIDYYVNDIRAEVELESVSLTVALLGDSSPSIQVDFTYESAGTKYLPVVSCSVSKDAARCTEWKVMQVGSVTNASLKWDGVAYKSAGTSYLSVPNESTGSESYLSVFDATVDASPNVPEVVQGGQVGTHRRITGSFQFSQ